MWALIRNGLISLECGCRGRHVQREDRRQIGVMLPPAKDHLGPPEAGRGKEASHPYGLPGQHGPAMTFVLDL